MGPQNLGLSENGTSLMLVGCPKCNASTVAQRAWGNISGYIMLSYFIIIKVNIQLPTQLKPSPIKPSLHSHVKEPGEFSQWAFESHGIAKHSSKSRMNKQDVVHELVIWFWWTLSFYFVLNCFDLDQSSRYLET